MHATRMPMVVRSFAPLFFLLLLPWTTHASVSPSLSAPPQTIPRSTDWSDDRFPPWNLSPKIDDDGFLQDIYPRVPGDYELVGDENGEFQLLNLRRLKHQNPASFISPEEILQIPVRVRQVPGDGNCLFHSITTCYAHAVNGTHIDLQNRDTLQWLYHNSACLRQKAVDRLEQYLERDDLPSNNIRGGAGTTKTHRPRDKMLYMYGDEYVKTSDLVEAAAAQYGIDGVEYCHLMRQNSYWGGGPEIVALSNVLRRPIHVYELQNEPATNFVFRRMACFGSPNFDDQTALHILSADSRFPDIEPGRQMRSGNHFLTLFPEWPDEMPIEESDDTIKTIEEKLNERKPSLRKRDRVFNSLRRLLRRL